MASTIGVLWLQGDYAKHVQKLKSLHTHVKVVRWPEDLKGCDGLILPGGESTTFLNLMHRTGLYEAIPEYAQSYPLMGTCAGSIVLATQVLNDMRETLGLIDIRIERNAYGRQVDSFADTIQIPLFEKNPGFEAVFIRAPIIREILGNTQILAQHNNEIVLARNENVLVATFHPELTRDNRLHRYFVDTFVLRE